MAANTTPPSTIPPRTSLRVPKQRRRRSLADAPSTPASKRSPNHVTVKPASPEVISSLISSLSAISSSTEEHFPTLSDLEFSSSTPVSPHPYQADFLLPPGADGSTHGPVAASPSKIGFGMEHSTAGRGQNRYLHPSAAPPTRAPLRSATSCQDLRPRLRGSHITRGQLTSETYSIGNLSIESRPWQSSTSLSSVDSGQQQKIRRSYKGLGIKGSRDRLQDKTELERVQGNFEHTITPDRLVPQSSPLAKSVSESTASTSQSSKSPRIPKRASSIHSVTSSGRRSEDRGASPSIASNGPVVPSRQSSLRHSIGATSSRRRRSYRSNNPTPRESTVPVFDERNFQPDSIEAISMDSVEDEVTRRIKELKNQKRMRDISLTVTTPDLMSPTVNRSRSSSPWRPSHSSGTPVSASANGLGLQSQSEPIKEVVDYEQVAPIDENPAPSPAIAQRVDRNTKRNSLSSRSTASKSIAAVMPPERSHTAPIQRSNSKLRKRLSRPTSPTTAEKHRRTFSHPLSQSASPVIDRPKSTDSIDDDVNTYISAPKLSQMTTDPQTGRIISFSEVGDPSGSAVFCCVGMGLTRYITAFYDELAKTLKLRLITLDRPGVGGSEPYPDGSDTPLGWADDVLAVCQHLSLRKFSLLAHSAGAIYALATALRMPQHIRGRIHLLAPWIPPSQMSGIGTQQDSLPTSALPLTQRFLQSLPTTFLKAANSSYLRTTSASITTSLPKSPRKSRRRSPRPESPGAKTATRHDSKTRDPSTRQESLPKSLSSASAAADEPTFTPVSSAPGTNILSEKERQSTYDARLTEAIWHAATTGANPAVDLLVCLERRQPIGFRYVDISRSVVLHHGSKDSRVPVENVKWLGTTMRRCEVRILEGEGHGLMASAGVMGGVLEEMAREWEDWNRVVKGGRAVS
ncbi:MAG: hypothetical protein LQ342_004364 [Letrouitia transgressa]|nr:MAG: hypothetical protein LQ342_004364 [Letrouitia transgressa]